MSFIRFCVLALLMPLLLAGRVEAQTAPATEAEPAKVVELLRLLEDPEVKSWLQGKQAAPLPLATEEAVEQVEIWESQARTRIGSLLAAVPRVDDELSRLTQSVRRQAQESGFAPAAVLLALIIGIGIAVEWFFRRSVKTATFASRLLTQAYVEFSPLVIFSVTAAALFLLFGWPPLMRVVVLYSLLAVIGCRAAIALGRLALVVEAISPREFSRGRLFLAVLSAGLALSAIVKRLGMDPDARIVLAMGFSIALMLIVLVAIWAPRPDLPASMQLRVSRVLRTVGVVALWLLWCSGFMALFWLGVMFVVVPRGVAVTDRVTRAFAASRWGEEDTASLRTVLLVRGMRALVIVAAVAWVAYVWRHNLALVTGQMSLVQTIIAGLFKSVVILLVLDLGWQLMRAYIDRSLAVSTTEGQSPDEIARRSRIRTLLPIFRNALAAVLLCIAALTVLSQMGVEIGPLIAGAGVFGVAIGFGSQTLVKDVVSGIFYLMDDAFRVGEYIEAGSYTGVVESFSLRSVRLRHHRGAVFTVPFGSLGAIKNGSRDWTIDKFRIRVPFKTDLDKVRKIVKKIGEQLLDDPEFGPHFIKQLKLKGVEQIGEFGIELGVGFTCKPGEQIMIRRRAYTMLTQAFAASGIDFAQPTVQVGGEEKDAAAAARALQQKMSAEAQAAQQAAP
ncbi:mechanosensitive ion channel [Rhizobium sp. TRM95111]|uniref:mechanosensitive ion channel family protein n=1 Tax=Rhizobium alarense TaxID=2846851 RepID=UPI001F380D23|nr:mechanosensitive ion channel domain-containing protein [Rhizobium alarense]MCF3641193.1 mechanosensitive ion channel [Rhizobium alarense]